MFFRLALAALCLGVTAVASGVPAATPENKAIYLTPQEIEEIRRGSACKAFVRQIVQLKKKMSTTGIASDFYELKVLPVTEMVKGQKGRYYAVYLRDARRKRRFQFPGGRYVIRRFDTRFRASLSAFHARSVGAAAKRAEILALRSRQRQFPADAPQASAVQEIPVRRGDLPAGSWPNDL